MEELLLDKGNKLEDAYKKIALQDKEIKKLKNGDMAELHENKRKLEEAIKKVAEQQNEKEKFKNSSISHGDIAELIGVFLWVCTYAICVEVLPLFCRLNNYHT